MNPTVLKDLLVIFAIGVAVAFVLRKIGVPSIAGFIVAGIVVGPGILGVVDDVHEVEVFAEIGVVLLLFGIGLELSLEKLRRLWRPILLGGSLQVGVTIAAAAGIAAALSLGAGQALFAGFLIAVSSTAIVLRGLEYRREIDAPHGRFSLGILVFQDLCVVPMMLAVPLLAGAGSGWEPALALGKSVLVIAGVLVASRLVVPRLLHFVAATGQRDLFVLAMLLVCIGTAWIVSLAGVSLALGAFLAGLVVAGSQYREQALADLIPLREVLASLFFISVGMMLYPLDLLSDPLPVLGLLAAVLAGKFLIVTVVGLVLGIPLRVALITGLVLAQMGEFMFVLLKAAQGTGLASAPVFSNLLAAAILSMLVTPILMYASPHIAAGVVRFGALQRLLGVRIPEISDSAAEVSDHVIIAGCGITGRELAAALRARTIPYVIVELNPETVRSLLAQDEPAFFGDVTSVEILERLGLQRAREMVIAISDPDAALRTVRAARRLAPDLPLLVRARYVDEVARFLEAGATSVVPSEYESAVEILRQVLARHGAGPDEIESRVASMHARCRARDRSR
ncbi:MAG: cation:proton antiporter [Planctomycetota bacterium]|jgi:CPA2 family monovalent cation:H+ antiporter-2